jgi:prepilin-type N-terminal cleavage/methylation domain-containing protein/prepilin-type processing-associated H-X9-DG protein
MLPRRRHAHPAFTLIELLVVIAIIGVLVSLLLPALGKARKLSKATQCLSNQRSIGQALNLYANQYKEWIPREGTRGTSPQTLRARLPWPVALRPFLDDRATPNIDMDDQFVDAAYYWDPARPIDRHKIHYVANGMPFRAVGVVDTRGAADHLRRRGPTNLNRLTRTSDVIYLSCFTDDPGEVLYNQWRQEGVTDLAISQFYDVWEAAHVVLTAPAPRISHRRHGSGANAMFLDGHANFIDARDLGDINSWDDGDYRQ